MRLSGIAVLFRHREFSGLTDPPLRARSGGVSRIRPACPVEGWACRVPVSCRRCPSYRSPAPRSTHGRFVRDDRSSGVGPAKNRDPGSLVRARVAADQSGDIGDVPGLDHTVEDAGDAAVGRQLDRQVDLGAPRGRRSPDMPVRDWSVRMSVGLVRAGLISSRRRMHVSAVARGLPRCGSRNRAPVPSAAHFVGPVRGGSRPGRPP
jgi:hypothetical protein